MKVSEIIDLIATLSVGLDNIQKSDVEIYLKYLNLAHRELYRLTAQFNQDLIISETLINTQGSNTLTLSQIPVCINKVFVPLLNIYLPRISMVDVIDIDPSFQQTGYPVRYFCQKNVIQFYPKQTVNVYETIVWYCPPCSDFTIDTPESDIPYPVDYHSVLAKGALKYVFQEESGFRNTPQQVDALKDWENGSKELISSLINSGSQTFSTFRRV